ncbi:MAG: HD-GYP domain-containing protein [Gemmatimonadaceae bacterium]
MTEPITQPRPTLPATDGASSTFSERHNDAFVRKRGKDFFFEFYGALRNVKLYPPDNEVVQKSLQDLTAVTEDILRHESEMEMRVAGDFLFLNGTRLRLDLENYSTAAKIFQVFRDADVGSCSIADPSDPPSPRDWMILLNVIQSPTGEPSDRRVGLLGKLDQAGVGKFHLGEPTNAQEEFLEQSKEAAKRTYAHSVSVTKDVINSIRMGRSANIKKIKRVVQGIVDQILNEETSLIGLTTLRDYDEYTFTHSVNVCIFSVALGRKIGLTRLQLCDLGLAALMHDIGKTGIPLEILNKPSSLSDEEWRYITDHPWLGVIALSKMRAMDISYRSIIVAFEHHKKTDLTGYPKHIRPRTMSILSKIVAVADGFDAATTRRAYQTTPLSPADVLQEMRCNPKRGMDQVVVKAFMSLVGHYPVGTSVVLDTLELGIVHGANPSPTAISRPIVRIIADDKGNVLYPGHLVDLNEQYPDGGGFMRTIIKIVDPERYGIRVGDYFV